MSRFPKHPSKRDHSFAWIVWGYVVLSRSRVVELLIGLGVVYALLAALRWWGAFWFFGVLAILFMVLSLLTLESRQCGVETVGRGTPCSNAASGLTGECKCHQGWKAERRAYRDPATGRLIWSLPKRPGRPSNRPEPEFVETPASWWDEVRDGLRKQAFQSSLTLLLAVVGIVVTAVK